MLPGLDGTGLLLGDFARELGPGNQVDIIRYPATMTAYADLIAWLEQRLPAEDFAIVAESFSGPIAIDIASRNPRSLRAVVFVATFAQSPRRVSAKLVSAFQHMPIWPRAIAVASLPLVMGRFRPPGFLAAYRAALASVPMLTLLGRLKSVLSVDVCRQLAEITAPVAYIGASADRLVPGKAASLFRDHAKVFVELDAPHFLLQARPQDSAKIVAGFLASSH